MKKTVMAMILTPFFCIGAANAQMLIDVDPDLLNSRERTLGMHPWINPGWTWMTEDHVRQMLKAAGYDVIIGFNRSGEAWIGKAIAGGDSNHIVVNRYAEVYGHLDRKSLARREFEQKAKGEQRNLVATLNGEVTPPLAQLANGKKAAGQPSATVMGEVCWTWMREDQAMQLLKGKGYARIHSLRRGGDGNWEARALKDDVALRVDIDWYGNTIDQPLGHGGVAQADSTPEE
jgi:hypothetical protein